MNYGRDYGNRNFLERAAHTVRGWLGNRGGGYDDEYRGMDRGWDDDRGYREMGDVSGMNRGYGAATWRGRNPDWDRGDTGDWNRGTGGGWGRGGEYRTGGYNGTHGGWDVDWNDNRSGGWGMDRGGMGGMNRGWSGANDRDHMMGRDFMTNHLHFGHDWRSHHTDDDATMDMGRGDWNRGGMMGRGMDRDHDYDRDWNRGSMGGGMMGRGMQGGMSRGGMDRDWEDRGDWNRGGMGGGMGRTTGGAGMLGRDADVGDVSGGMIGNYGAYGNYGMERWRSASGGGVPTGQHYRGYGVGSGYRP